jgi:hypothetical protein
MSKAAQKRANKLRLEALQHVTRYGPCSHQGGEISGPVDNHTMCRYCGVMWKDGATPPVESSVTFAYHVGVLFGAVHALDVLERKALEGTQEEPEAAEKES